MKRFIDYLKENKAMTLTAIPAAFFTLTVIISDALEDKKNEKLCLRGAEPSPDCCVLKRSIESRHNFTIAVNPDQRTDGDELLLEAFCYPWKLWPLIADFVTCCSCVQRSHLIHDLDRAISRSAKTLFSLISLLASPRAEKDVTAFCCQRFMKVFSGSEVCTCFLLSPPSRSKSKAATSGSGSHSAICLITLQAN
eukprot:g41720.t1